MSEQDTVSFDEIGPEGLNDSNKKPPMGRNTRLLIGIIAALVIAVLGVLTPLLLDLGKSAPLTVTVFTNSGSEVTLKAGVETSLNEYLASGSDVPGFPLLIGADGADTVNVSVDAGTLFTWGAPDYVKDEKGMSWDMESNDTIYWSPYDAAGALIPQCTVTVTARKSDADTAQARLIVRQTGETAYSITLLAGES
jgi:hypothetical protein